MKKVLSFGIVTALVAGAVALGTPALKVLAETSWWWSPSTGYIQADNPGSGYTQVPNYNPSSGSSSSESSSSESSSSESSSSETPSSGTNTDSNVAVATPQNATPASTNGPTPHEQAEKEQTPASLANYQNWLATYGGGASAGTTVVSGAIGQPGSEVVISGTTAAAGQPVAMFQSTDASNTLLAGAVGVIPSGSKITTVEVAKDSPTFAAAQNLISKVSRRGTVEKVVGIGATQSDGVAITTIGGEVAISLPMPTDITVPDGKSLVVYLITDDGETIKLETIIDNGRVVCGTSAFGTFAFVVE
jgi:hypothetical protein